MVGFEERRLYENPYFFNQEREHVGRTLKGDSTGQIFSVLNSEAQMELERQVLPVYSATTLKKLVVDIDVAKKNGERYMT